MRILDAAAVDELIEYPMVLDAIRDLFSMGTGPEHMGYGRIDLAHPHGWLRSLPAYVADQDLLGFKVLHRTEGVGMRYTIYVHSLETGEPRGIVDALEVTNARTGAVTAVATEHLARPEIKVAALIGTGPVARGQLRALELVRPAREVRVFARTPARRESFVEEMAGQVSARLVAVASLEEALDGTSMVTLATKAAEPVLDQRHVRPGLHVNSVGPASRDRVEVDPALFKEFDRVVCDTVDLVLDEAGDAYQAVSFHGFERDAASDLADVVSGAGSGRLSADEMTLFKSVGTGAQDLVVAARLLALAETRDVGTVVGGVNSVKPG